MIILGIDPGSLKTGWGLITARGSALALLDAGVIRTVPQNPFQERLKTISLGLQELVKRHRPDCVAMEGIFQSTTKNMQSALKLGQARGAALVTLALADLDVCEYPPAEIKKALTGNGRAEKGQVREMVRGLLGIRGPLSEDASDALSVAICHSFRASVPALGGGKP